MSKVYINTKGHLLPIAVSERENRDSCWRLLQHSEATLWSRQGHCRAHSLSTIADKTRTHAP